MPDGRIRCLAAGRKDLAHDSHQSGWALSGGPHGGVAMAASIATATAGMARTAYQCTNHHCCAGRFDDPERSPAACFGNSFANAADCRYQPASRREVGLFLRVVWLGRSPFASRLCVCRRPVSPGQRLGQGACCCITEFRLSNLADPGQLHGPQFVSVLLRGSVLDRWGAGSRGSSS